MHRSLPEVVKRSNNNSSKGGETLTLLTQGMPLNLEGIPAFYNPVHLFTSVQDDYHRTNIIIPVKIWKKATFTHLKKIYEDIQSVINVSERLYFI